MLNPKSMENGCEQYEFFTRNKKEDYVQYDYRHTDNELFSCIAKNLDEAREKKEQWISKNNENNMSL